MSGGRKAKNAQTSLDEAQRFLDITQKQEKGGEVAHSDVIKARLQVQQRQRDLQDSLLNVEKAKIALAVLIFPDLQQNYSVVDDLAQNMMLPPFPEAQATGRSTLPNFEVANRQNLGYQAQVALNIPLWNWGATRSKVKQAELRAEQAHVDLTLAQRQLQANLQSFYKEAVSALSQLDSLRSCSELSAESLRLTILRYTAGEATALEVTDAQTTAVQARNASDDGLLRYRVALANLQALTGTF